jgi:hypothetical protein
MVRRVRSRTQTAILKPHVVASAAPGVHRRESDACLASRSLLCGHEALPSSRQFAPTASRRPLKPAAHAGKPRGAWSHPGGRIDCPLRPRSVLQPRLRSVALDCETRCLVGASGAINDHCTAANSIDRKTPNHAYVTALPTLHARERLSANQ